MATETDVLGGQLHLWLQGEFNTVKQSLNSQGERMAVMQSDIASIREGHSGLNDRLGNVENRVTSLEDGVQMKALAWSGPKRVMIGLSIVLPTLTGILIAISYLVGLFK